MTWAPHWRLCPWELRIWATKLEVKQQLAFTGMQVFTVRFAKNVTSCCVMWLHNATFTGFHLPSLEYSKVEPAGGWQTFAWPWVVQSMRHCCAVVMLGWWFDEFHWGAGLPLRLFQETVSLGTTIVVIGFGSLGYMAIYMYNLRRNSSSLSIYLSVCLSIDLSIYIYLYLSNRFK